MKWYLKALKQYADFSGRARRKEYWMFVLFNIIFSLIASLIDKAIGIDFSDGYGYGIVTVIYALIVFIPGLALTVRRLHDINKSGWMIFISLIPLIGGIWMLVLVCTEGTRGDNQYGPDPKTEGVAMAG